MQIVVNSWGIMADLDVHQLVPYVSMDEMKQPKFCGNSSMGHVNFSSLHQRTLAHSSQGVRVET